MFIVFHGFRAIATALCVTRGTAIYVGHLPKEFHQFVDRFRLQLSQVRPWVFVLGTNGKRSQALLGGAGRLKIALSGIGPENSNLAETSLSG